MFGRTGDNSWPSTSSILLWDLNTQLARKITGRVLFQACDRRSNLHFIFENVMIGLFYVCGNYFISPYDNVGILVGSQGHICWEAKEVIWFIRITKTSQVDLLFFPRGKN